MTQRPTTHPELARRGGFLAVALAVLLAGCGDIFTVKNPGQIQEDDLNTTEGMSALVVGMSVDISQAYEWLAFDVAQVADELAGSGSYSSTALLRKGIIDRDSEGFLWDDTQQARWVAEDGVRRMQDVLGDDFGGRWDLAAQAYLFAGYANRVLGELFCHAVFDGGGLQPRSAYFERAIPHFQNAVSAAQNAGNSQWETAAHAGLAQAYVGLGQWGQAASEAAMVPNDFVRWVVYDDDTDNDVVDETWGRHEMSAWNTLAYTFDPPDPRAPWIDCREPDSGCPNGIGADGQTPHIKQAKYTDDNDDIAIAKGTEMRLIEAEAALRNGDVGTFVQKVNEARAYYGIDPVDPGSVTSSSTSFDADDPAWQLLDRERHLTLWLEARRLFDMRRWDHPFLDGGEIVYPSVARRDDCFPISNAECSTNDNIRGTEAC